MQWCYKEWMFLDINTLFWLKCFHQLWLRFHNPNINKLIWFVKERASEREGTKFLAKHSWYKYLHSHASHTKNTNRLILTLTLYSILLHFVLWEAKKNKLHDAALCNARQCTSMRWIFTIASKDAVLVVLCHVVLISFNQRINCSFSDWKWLRTENKCIALISCYYIFRTTLNQIILNSLQHDESIRHL